VAAHSTDQHPARAVGLAAGGEGVRPLAAPLGHGFLELSGQSAEPANSASMIWLQVRDVEVQHERLRTVGVTVLRAPRQEPWA